MARCGCASDRCTCTVVGGSGIEVSGTGTPTNPYTVSATGETAGGGGDSSGRFSGEIVAFGGPVAPTGWLICDGSELPRGAYAALFAVIGVAYGAGDGSSTFNIPDLTGRFPLGVDSDHGRGVTGGASVLTESHIPQHNHAIDHNHAAFNTSSTGGAHDHTTSHNDVDGPSPSTFRSATFSGHIDDRLLVDSDGEHVHNIDVPNFTGQSGSYGTVTPTEFIPPYGVVTYLIKV